MLPSKDQRETKRRRIGVLSEGDGSPSYVAMSFRAAKKEAADPNCAPDAMRTLVDMRSDQVGTVTAAMETQIRFSRDPFHRSRSDAITSELLMTTIRAMEKWHGSEAVQEYGCALLQSLLHNLDEGTAGLVPLEEAMNALLVAMGNHPRTLKVQCHACMALSNLFSGSDRTIADCAARFVKPNGGFQRVLWAMEQFRDETQIQEGGLGLLYNLFAYPLCGIPIRVSGAITAVARAIDSHHDNEDIQEIGRDVMKHFFP
jgi:ribosomal protein S27E